MPEYTCRETGNDRWLCEIAFPGKARGFYLEIGAGHPVQESASYALEQLGWYGVSFEPNETLCGAWRSARLNPCRCQAVWTDDGWHDFVIPFLEPYRGGLVDARIDLQLQFDAAGNRLAKVKCVSWGRLLASIPQPIDVVLIDAEASERHFLPQFPFASRPVGAWIIETAWPYWLSELMTDHGYVEVRNPFNRSATWERYFLPGT